ncbi:MAG: UDP-N-acetylmuramoyl-L-alanyl-D-glutamate--2,6-diaminopimelate ligase [Firmicutes bacterium]|nr:UDP-N-acetylmuramoyl-L-alanyl-D-glutamate--2,6-diaminopimelate ligase [Bacillota bacterium]
MKEGVDKLQFKDILSGWVLLAEGGHAEISGVTDIAHLVQPGFVFVAIKGTRVDGHKLVAEALRRGAVAVVTTERVPLPEGIAYALVGNTRAAFAHMLSLYHGSPSQRLRVIGITGTNGKTTTAFLIQSILRAAGFRVGLMGTVHIDTGRSIESSTLTTPDAPLLYGALSRMTENALTHAVMEVSSHSLVLGRVDAVEFDTAVFLNLTQDHLDLHHTMEAYFQAKAQLFTCLGKNASKSGKAAIINIDDEYGQRLVGMTGGAVLTFAIDQNADFVARDIRSGVFGASFRLETPVGACEIEIRTPGRHSIYNALAAAGAALAEGASLGAIAEGLNMPGVPGRMEKVPAGQDFDVFVDYAHTPDGLLNVLKAARSFTRGRLIIVFGCGGDRDKGKRPIMGEIAARLADVSIVTSDNPRSENPAHIIEGVLSGITEASAIERTIVETDRKQAIKRAVAMAEAGDVIIVAGKGHENYQIFYDQTIHFDDREEARRAVEERQNV